MLSLFSVNVVFVKLAIGCVGAWLGWWLGGWMSGLPGDFGRI